MAGLYLGLSSLSSRSGFSETSFSNMRPLAWKGRQIQKSKCWTVAYNALI